MSMHSFRKGLIIFLADIFIIIGIFVLQFRTDSTIIEKIGGLQVTLEKQENPENDVFLKNNMVVTYNGLNFFSDDQNSIKMLPAGKSKTQNLTLKNWAKRDDKGISLYFSDDVTLMFDLGDDEENAPLTVGISMPAEVETVFVPFNFAYNMKVQKDDGNRVVLNGKKNSWNFSTNQVEKGYIKFNGSEYTAHYALYTEEKKFSFDTITELALADETMYKNTVSTLTNNLISSFKNVISENNFTEASAVAYVAAMGEKGRYQQAVEEIPSSYKKSNSRTYVSAPFFNNLSKMNATLEKELASNEIDFTNALTSNSVDVFTKDNVAAKLIISSNKTGTTELLKQAAAVDVEACTLAQVNGLLKTYVELKEYKSDYATLLAPVVEKCIEKITAACEYDGSILTLKENNQFLSVIQAVDIGVTLLRYGDISSQSVYQKAGRIIVNSYLAEGSAFDLRTLTTIYPLLAYNNWYYPHYVILEQDNNLMWAWTCAKAITAERNEESELNLSINFPEGEIHHVIFKGIPKFSNIYIYNMAYRTDPRFETYNSSGYVYKEEGNTLLLKSRHKSQIENVRMTPKK
ncbi:MAG: hypothetical protein SOW31_05255 [Treponema sp.]|nr:hypothetical protein [Spirochaetia bacterium]MDY3131111.1 hypothetical protein [Treponema sp.]